VGTAHDIWDQPAEKLKMTGYTVLTFDLFGHGRSDSIEQAGSARIYVGQLSELLFALRMTESKNGRSFPEKVNLMGIGTGATITAAFSGTYSAAVEKLVMVGPLITSKGAMLMDADAAGRNSTAFVDSLILHSITESGEDRASELQQRQRRQHERHAGHALSVASTVQSFTPNTVRELYQRLGSTSVPTLMLWGDEDQVVPYSSASTTKELIPHVNLTALDGVGHWDSFLVPRHVEVLHDMIHDFVDIDLEVQEDANGSEYSDIQKSFDNEVDSMLADLDEEVDDGGTHSENTNQSMQHEDAPPSTCARQGPVKTVSPEQKKPVVRKPNSQNKNSKGSQKSKLHPTKPTQTRGNSLSRPRLSLQRPVGKEDPHTAAGSSNLHNQGMSDVAADEKRAVP